MLEDTSGAFTMGVFILGENKEVIHVYDEPFFGNHVLEGVVHESLECGWGVGKPKEHNGWFKESFVSDEGGFPFVAIFDPDVVVAPSDIELSE